MTWELQTELSTFYDISLLPGGAVPEEVATQASAAREDTEDDWGLPGDKGEEVRGHHHQCGQDREEQGQEEEGAEVERELSELPSNDNI